MVGIDFIWVKLLELVVLFDCVSDMFVNMEVREVIVDLLFEVELIESFVCYCIGCYGSEDEIVGDFDLMMFWKEEDFLGVIDKMWVMCDVLVRYEMLLWGEE